jgi:hypothetical protein
MSKKSKKSKKSKQKNNPVQVNLSRLNISELDTTSTDTTSKKRKLQEAATVVPVVSPVYASSIKSKKNREEETGRGTSSDPQFGPPVQNSVALQPAVPNKHKSQNPEHQKEKIASTIFADQFLFVHNTIPEDLPLFDLERTSMASLIPVIEDAIAHFSNGNARILVIGLPLTGLLTVACLSCRFTILMEKDFTSCEVLY